MCASQSSLSAKLMSNDLTLPVVFMGKVSFTKILKPAVKTNKQKKTTK